MGGVNFYCCFFLAIRDTARVRRNDAVGGNHGNHCRDHFKHQHRARLSCV